jgi:heme-degrading monooxygenase HmoA
MFVRVVTSTGAKDIDAGLKFVKDTVAPLLRQQNGWKGTTASANRSSGEFSVLTQWESKADLEASESALQKVRGEAAEILGGTMTVDVYEQVVFDVVKPPHVGARLLIRPISMDVSSIDENIEFFKSTVLPQLRQGDGYLALRNLINRETGRGAVGSLWETDEALEAAAAAAEARRSIGEQRGITFGEFSKRETIFADMP